ncbi:MAG: tetratricopeptide repeat protein [Bacteroidaceae bacterium]|nr:tetratricopeptide repeat protein [Bacteroidaceae bacterium]
MQLLQKSRIVTLFTLMLLFTGIQQAFAEEHTPDYYDTNVRDHFKHQRWTEGKKLLNKAMVSYGDLSVINELQGWYYYHFKQYTQARFFLYKSLRDDKSNQHSRELLVNVEEETRNYSSAICYINEILEYNPYDRGWWRRKINIFRKMGNQQEADRLLARLRQIYPNDPQIKKDIDYQMELNLATYKKRGDLDGMIKSLRQLIHTYPNNGDNYLQLSNILLQQGKTAEAAEVAAQGVRNSRSAALVRKHVGILAEQGRYSEALSYVKECQKTLHIPGLDGLVAGLEEDAARNSISNDPYIMYGKIYERTHNSDALTFLLNTSIARGYDEDALFYISEAKKGRGDNFDLLYKEYCVNKRMGNTKQANKLLEKIGQMAPGNEEIREELATLHFNKASEAMFTGSYDDAIAELQYVLTHSTDSEMKQSCERRLYNCFIETKDYTNATAQLNSIKGSLEPYRYNLMRADLLKSQGKNGEALKVLKEAYENSSSPTEKLSYADSYEEIVYPIIKGLMEQNLMKPANEMAMEAVEICPNSQLLYHQAISTSDVLGKNQDYVRLVSQARSKFPDDPYFIVKEAGIYAKDGDYEAARTLIRPLLDTYVGDSAIINAYVGNCEMQALKLRKDKNYNEALNACNDALVWRADNKELLYTKGLIFEDLHQYDSAYYYQRKHEPSLMELKEFKHHLETLQYKKAKNTIAIEYSHMVNGPNNKRQSIAHASYTRKYEKNSYEFTFGYAGRDGMADKAYDVDTQEPGGTGVQGGFNWTHQWRKNSTFTVGGSAATKYFPVFAVKGAIDFFDVKLGRNFPVDIQGHAAVRWIRSYSK